MRHGRGARIALALGAVLAAADVALRAWSAHGLSASLDAEGLRLFEAARGHLFGCAIGLMLAGLRRASGGGRLALAAAAVFALGLVLFSGDLFQAAGRADHATWGTAPFGGTATMLAWLLLAADAVRGGDGAGTQI